MKKKRKKIFNRAFTCISSFISLRVIRCHRRSSRVYNSRRSGKGGFTARRRFGKRCCFVAWDAEREREKFYPAKTRGRARGKYTRDRSLRRAVWQERSPKITIYEPAERIVTRASTDRYLRNSDDILSLLPISRWLKRKFKVFLYFIKEIKNERKRERKKINYVIIT